MLENQIVYLEPIKSSDTEDIIRWRNQPYVRSKFIYQELFTKESHEQWLRTMVDTGRVAQFIIYSKADGKAVGSVYLRDIDQKSKKAEYGIFIGEEAYLGKGLGTAAAEVVLTYAFEELKLHKVMLRVLATNQRAIASYKKAGFIEEGCFRDEVKVGDQYQDVIFMGILEIDYKKLLLEKDGGELR